MTTIAERETPDARHGRASSSTWRWSLTSAVVAVVVAAGTGLVAYPSAATWFTDLTHAATVSGYSRTVAETDAGELADLLAAARTYNAHLPEGPLRDPYILNAQGGGDAVHEGHEDYLAQLSFRPGAPMARIRIPEISVDLPVYHGTDEETLALGIGHLYGSGLPVGGMGTHAVLTGHSGIPGVSLFTHLDELETGDTFTIDVAGEHLVYRIDRIETVLPDDGDLLRQVPGHDYVTLLTCTPTGVNTHRLLVRGERVDVTSTDAEEQELTAEPVAPSIPWEALVILIGGLAIAITIGRPRRGPPSSNER